MSKGYDSACFDLAVHFLDGDECKRCGISHPHRDACNDELAQLIQNTVEGFLSTHECRKAYDAPVFDGGKHYLPDVRSDVPRPTDRTPCPVHDRTVDPDLLAAIRAAARVPKARS